MEELNRADAIVKAAVLFPLSWEVPTHDIIDIDELIQIVKNGEYAESEDVRYNADINTAYSSLWIGEDRLVLLEISH